MTPEGNIPRDAGCPRPQQSGDEVGRVGVRERRLFSISLGAYSFLHATRTAQALDVSSTMVLGGGAPERRGPSSAEVVRAVGWRASWGGWRGLASDSRRRRGSQRALGIGQTPTRSTHLAWSKGADELQPPGYRGMQAWCVCGSRKGKKIRLAKWGPLLTCGPYITIDDGVKTLSILSFSIRPTKQKTNAILSPQPNK